MREQLICAKCGRNNWSRWFETCECLYPDFKYKTYDEYLEAKKKEAIENERI